MKWKYNCKKRNQYYDAAIRLYIHEKMGGRKISRFIPVSESIISRWIRNFTAETKGQVVMKSKSSAKASPSTTKSWDSEGKALQAEIRRLKKELAHESLRADAFNELINVAEKQFNISIRKSWRQVVKNLHAEDSRHYRVSNLCTLFDITKQP